MKVRAHRRERAGKTREENDDRDDQPHVIGFPDRADRVRDRRPLSIGRSAARKQIPEAAAVVGAAEERVRCERADESRREKLDRIDHASLRFGAVSRTVRRMSPITTVARTT